MAKKGKAHKADLLLYRVMYRPLYKFKDTIFDMWAKDFTSMLSQLRSRGVPEEVKYIYVHEYGEDGIKEVLTYEAPQDSDQLTNKPKIRVKAKVERALKLSGNSVTYGLYTAHEVAACA